MKNFLVSIIGMGYVGLCTAVGFASKENTVIAVDNDPAKVDSINKAVSPFHEPQLNHFLQKAVKDGYLKSILDLEEAILSTAITFITVGTPSKADGSIDLQQIQNSIIKIGEALNKKNGYHLVVVKSTVVPGTTENFVKPLLEKHSNKNCGSDFGLCMNPEFLREGSAIHDTFHPDRVIIGGYDKKSGDTLESLYKKFYAEECPSTIRTNLPTAELIKYANNAYLATKISYINTIANICEKIPETDIKTVAKAIGLDDRISPKFLRAGLGYGGSCFPKDLKALISFSNQSGYEPILLQSVQKVNENQPKHAIDVLKNELGTLTNKKIAILGLSFKPDTDDMREARSIPLIEELLNNNAKVTAYDPVAVSNARKIFKNKIQYATSAIDCIKDADCCIIVTEWKEFKQLTPEDYKKHMKTPFLIDGRRIYNPEQYSTKLKYKAIGLGQDTKNN
jgi:UDPglucose 6-dehydrogenase